MPYKILIDQHWRVYYISHNDPVESEYTAEETAIRNRGLTPQTRNVTNFPANYRKGWVLARDGSRCDPPGDDHTPQKIAVQRTQVVEWAARETSYRNVLRGGFDRATRHTTSSALSYSPSRFQFWLLFVLRTLEIAGDDDLIVHASVWPALQKSMKADCEWFIANMHYTNWAGQWTRMSNRSRAYYIDEDENDNLETSPTTLAGPTANQMSRNEDWAWSQIGHLA